MDSEKEITSTTIFITDLEKPNTVNVVEDKIKIEHTKRVNTRSKAKITSVKSDNEEEDEINLEKSSTRNSPKKLCLDDKYTQIYECISCPKSFSRLNQLKAHFRVHKKQKVIAQYGCVVCHEKVDGLKQFLEHKKVCGLEVYKCDECNLDCSNYSGYKAHMKLHNGDRPFSCKECGATFAQSGHLSIHRRTHTGEKPYTCEICTSQFKQISHLKTHVRTHTHDRPYQCSVCPAAFTQNSSLKRHIRSHTGEKPYKCMHCSMTFVVKSNMQRHLHTHTGERPFVCDICPSSFGQPIDLQRHKISHTGIKPYKCQTCDASFSRKNNLKWHQRTHSDSSSFKCGVCMVGFTTSGDLKAHMRNHAPPKPFPCDICPSSFRLMDSLKRHKMIHTGERPLRNRPQNAKLSKIKPHTCPVCAASFCEKRNLKRHVVSIHGSDNLTSSCLLQEKVESTSVIKNEFFFKAEDKNEQSTLKIKLADSVAEARVQTKDCMSSQQICIQPIVSAAPGIQQIIMQPVQSSDGVCHVPQFMISGTGQAPRPARPAGNCQNHSLHILTFLDGSYNQWQSWCFCNPPNIPETTSSVIVPAITTESVVDTIPQIVITTGIEQAVPDSTTHYVVNLNPADANQSVILNTNPAGEIQNGITSLTLTS